MKEFISLKEVCEFAHVSRGTMRRWIASGLVHAVKDCKDKSSPIRIEAETLQAFLAGKAEMWK